MIFSYDDVSETILFSCPQCKREYENDGPEFLTAISFGETFKCVDCKCEWKVEIVPLDPRSPTPREPVQSGQKCPTCNGFAHIADKRNVPIMCPTCNGTGISNRPDGGLRSPHYAPS